MSKKSIFKKQALIVAVAAVVATVVQRLILGEANPAISGGVAGGVAAILIFKSGWKSGGSRTSSH